MAQPKAPEKPALRAVADPTPARIHPMFPALRTYPAQVRVYRVDRDGSQELLETMSAADLDPGVEPLAVSQTLARSALRVAFGPGVYKVQGLSDGGGVLGGPQRVFIGETDDDQRPHQHAPRPAAPVGPSPLAQSVDAAVTTTAARGMVDELRASAARSAEASNNQVAAMAAMMQAQMQSQATLFGTVLQTIQGNARNGTDPVLLEILRERGTNNAALLESNSRLRDELAELRRKHAVEGAKGEDVVTRKLLDIGESVALAIAARSDAQREERSAPRADAPRLPAPSTEQTVAPAPAKPPTLLETIDAHAAIDAASVDLDALALALDRAARGELVEGDAARVLVAGVLARDGQLPPGLHSDMTRALLRLGSTRVRSR